MQRALTGVRVVALEHAAAGPFGSRLLADAGATVIKIERPGTGDMVRTWDRVVRGMSAGFVWLNRGKSSVVIDLKKPQGTVALRRVVATADVFMTNLGPAAVERLGLGYESFAGTSPHLVYCSISGYGTTGPYRDAKAYDLLIEGESGIIATTGTADHPAKAGVAIADIGAGTYAALAIVMALWQRERTGRGQFIDIAMFEVMLDWLGFFPHHYWHGRHEPPRVGMRHNFIVPYGVFTARDEIGVNLSVGTQVDWELLCTVVLNRPDLLTDTRFEDGPARRANRDVLESLLEDIFRREDAETWFERLERSGLAYGRVRSIPEVLTHPQLVARKMVRDVDSPIGPVPTIESAIRMSDSPTVETALPMLGGDSVTILEEAGFSEAEVAVLISEGVVMDGRVSVPA